MSAVVQGTMLQQPATKLLSFSGMVPFWGPDPVRDLHPLNPRRCAPCWGFLLLSRCQAVCLPLPLLSV